MQVHSIDTKPAGSLEDRSGLRREPVKFFLKLTELLAGKLFLFYTVGIFHRYETIKEDTA